MPSNFVFNLYFQGYQFFLIIESYKGENKMWDLNAPSEKGWYWVTQPGQLTGKDYTHPVHVYKSNKKLDKPDTVFSDGDNFKITSGMFKKWYSKQIPIPAKEFKG